MRYLHYLQRSHQVHKPTTQNTSLRYWGGPVSCRSPTPVVIPQTSLQGATQTHLCLWQFCWKSQNISTTVSDTVPHLPTFLHAASSTGCKRTEKNRCISETECLPQQSPCNTHAAARQWKWASSFCSHLFGKECACWPDSQVQPVKQEIVCGDICYVCHGGRVELWQDYTLSMQAENKNENQHELNKIRNISISRVRLKPLDTPGSAGKTPEGCVETLPKKKDALIFPFNITLWHRHYKKKKKRKIIDESLCLLE